jgi:ankyrin repeat protein
MLASKPEADVNVINRNGASALHLVIASDSARSLEMFETLIKAGADVNVVSRDGGKPALQLAIVSGKGRSFEIFEALLESKADVNVINGDGASALHLVIASNARILNCRMMSKMI